MLLEVKNLKSYFKTREGVVKAVDDVSFTLEKGEILGLAGESGCGKTTTCLSIIKLLPPAGEYVNGQILHNGINLLEIAEEEMREIRGNDISMVFQGAMNAMNPVHKVGDQVLEVIKIHEPEIPYEEARKRVVDILEIVGIDSTRVDDYPHQLSGGMKQRALIAMALVCNPDIIIADEPVTALDVIVQAQILKAMKQLQQEFDLSMIMITHDLSVIANVCDKVAIMYAGKICEYGTVKQIFTEPKHPYTKGLINAFPSIKGPKQELYDIGGAPPDLLNPPSGCRFNPRCDKVMDICRIEIPEEIPMDSGYVTCHLYTEENVK